MVTFIEHKSPSVAHVQYLNIYLHIDTCELILSAFTISIEFLLNIRGLESQGQYIIKWE